MKINKNIIKVRLLTAFNIQEEKFLEEEDFEFESEICRFASKCLSVSELLVFHYIFKCEKTYEEIHAKLEGNFNKDLTIASIKRTENRMKEKLTNSAHKNKKFKVWMQKHAQKN